MLTLRALLQRHASILLIDSASARIQVALFRRDQDTLWKSSAEEAGTALFSLTEKTLSDAGPAGQPLPLSTIGAFVFCDGPGSVLGIRTAAVAIRTWNALHPRPAYAFSSLAVVAHALVRTQNQRHFSVIADARRETWHCVSADSIGGVSKLQRIPTAGLTGPCYQPENFRHWSALPAGVKSVPYDLASQLPPVSEVPLFMEAPEPDAFLHEEPSYQTWTPQIHRAPS